MTFKIINAYYAEANPFITYNPTDVLTPKNYKALDKNSLLILWGGSDIATEIYNQTPSKYGSNELKSQRDKFEIDLFNKACDLQIPIVGVCRGAQLMTALTGGTLVQHIEEHNYHNHYVTTDDGTQLETNSCHHQMMVPAEGNPVLAWGSSTQGVDANDNFITYDKVPEMVYFPSIRGLGIQGHIEWSTMSFAYRMFFEKKLGELLLNGRLYT